MEDREEERGGGVVTRSHSDLNTCGCWVKEGGGGGEEKRKLSQVYSRQSIIVRPRAGSLRVWYAVAAAVSAEEE